MNTTSGPTPAPSSTARSAVCGGCAALVGWALGLVPHLGANVMQDALKALCLGARGVLIGRPFLYALAVGGADAASGMLAMLREEIEVSMTLLGVRRLSELSADLVTRV